MTQFIATLSGVGKAAFSGTARATKLRSSNRSLTGFATFNGSVRFTQSSSPERALLGRATFGGKVVPLLKYPYGAFRDFAHYKDTMLDPAMVLVNERLGGVTTYDAAAPSNMRRVWLTTTPPAEYKVSGGATLWPRAAFMGIGVRVNSLLYNGYQYIDGGQVEITPKAVTTGPAPYTPARSMSISVRADQMNYVRDPQTNSTVASGTTASRPVTAIVGSYYAAAVDVTDAPAGAVFEAYLTDSSGRVGESGLIVVPPTKVVPRVVVRSTEPVVSTSVNLVLSVVSGGSITFSNPRVDRVSGIGPLGDPRYLDGSLGDDYLWGGAVNASESYFYRDRTSRTYLLSRLLEENLPLGVIPSQPKFAVLPTE